MDSELNAQRHAARKILWAWGNTLNRIERLEAYRRAFELFAEDARETLHAQSLSGMPRGGRSRDISDIVVKVTERAQKYEQEAQKVDVQIADALRLRSTVEEFLDTLETDERRIVEYRYADGHQWHFIAMKMNMDMDHCRKIDRRVVDRFAKNVFIR